jgi:hypothetical protein
MTKSTADAATPVPPLRLVVAITPLVRLALRDINNRPLGQGGPRLNAIAEGKADKDHLCVTVARVPQGVRVRVELEETALRALGVLWQMALQGFGR